jgi:hypothetical protein
MSLESMTDDIWIAHYQSAVPRFFLTGDGHGNPPFDWVVRKKDQAMGQHFLKLAEKNKLCLYVEQLPEQVNATSVPTDLQVVLHNRCVFGWELPIFGPVGAAINSIDFLMDTLCGHPAADHKVHEAVAVIDQCINLVIAAFGNDIAEPYDPRLPNAAATWAPIKLYLDKKYGKGGLVGLGVGGLVGLGLAQAGTDFISNLLPKFAIPPRDAATKTTPDEHSKSLMQLKAALLTLRDSQNPVIGAGIMAKIKTFSGNHTHLIACGYGHIQNVHPLLQDCINIANEVGIVDPITKR